MVLFSRAGGALTTRALCFAAVAAFAVSAQAADTPDMFIKDAIQGNLAEVRMGELAQKNGSSAAVKDFGRMLVEDHGKAANESTAIAKKMSIEAPKEPKPEAQAMAAKMAKMQGAEFDKHFASHMVMEHEKEIKKYQDAAKAHASTDVGMYASSSVPVLQKHLKTAQALPK
jgi:putative membrane protein